MVDGFGIGVSCDGVGGGAGKEGGESVEPGGHRQEREGGGRGEGEPAKSGGRRKREVRVGLSCLVGR